MSTSMWLAKPGDTIYVQHDPKRQAGTVYERSWSDKEKQGCKVWRKPASDPQVIDITPQIDKVEASGDSLTLHAAGETLRVPLGRERAPGMLAGRVPEGEPA